jgi:hypothetical protein
VYGDSLGNDCIMFHVAHTQHSIYLLDTQPMENIGHQSLESHILHTGDIFGSFEIFRGTVRSTLSRIVDEVLQH